MTPLQLALDTLDFQLQAVPVARVLVADLATVVLEVTQACFQGLDVTVALREAFSRVLEVLL